jgi:hypothetical protein
VGYIKDYNSARLMQCDILSDPKIVYTESQTIIKAHKLVSIFFYLFKAVYEAILNYTKRKERELTSYDRTILSDNFMDGISPGDKVLTEIQSPNCNNSELYIKESKEFVPTKMGTIIE